ncbi:hypothetical protein PWT90_00291 [Aphanocladium album]|nr:hypothetical protein PWT90_00291 [Aphanocladium album]
MPSTVQLPIIDFERYFSPKSPEDVQDVIAEVREACNTFGFFQLKGHGVSLDIQRGLFLALKSFFSLGKDEKLKYSFLEHPCRRGYEASGMSLRDGDKMADSKEVSIGNLALLVTQYGRLTKPKKCFYVGREDSEIADMGFYGPNNWPDLPAEQFKGPIWSYYEATSRLGRAIWEILLQGLGHTTEAMETFAKKPVVPLKMLRYPRPSQTLPGQFGAGAHMDFGGVTVLLQQPGQEGLEVWLEDSQEWLSVPALEDVFVINCGDMIQRWSGGQYKSVLHRVINKTDAERYSCALFWHGDIRATNPLNPEDPDKSTVGQLWMNRFKNQMSIPRDAIEVFSK